MGLFIHLAFIYSHHFLRTLFPKKERQKDMALNSIPPDFTEGPIYVIKIRVKITLYKKGVHTILIEHIEGRYTLPTTSKMAL